MHFSYAAPLTVGSLSPESSKTKYSTAITLIAAGMSVRDALALSQRGILNDGEVTNPTVTDRELLKIMADFRAHAKGQTKDLVYAEAQAA